MSEHTSIETEPRKLRCEEWEALLADALDGALATGDRSSFELHTSDCPSCATMLGEAQTGQQWLQFLHPEPSIPADLLERILSRSTGPAAPGLRPAISPALPLPAALHHVKEWKRLSIPAGMRRFVEPRMMMTAAMAFFSIALTLNLAGVRLTSMRSQDLRPSVLFSTLQRQFYNTAAAPVVRYYDNLRVVYEVESRMRELRRTTESDESRTPPKTDPAKAPAIKEPGGNARKNGGKSESPRTAGSSTIFTGPPVRACFEGSLNGLSRLSTHAILTHDAANSLFPKRADQAKRSLA